MSTLLILLSIEPEYRTIQQGTILHRFMVKKKVTNRCCWDMCRWRQQHTE
jgi:hypothetical protein